MEQPPPTKLTRYFEICESNKNDLTISNLRYIDFPKHFIWKNGNWQRRKQGGDKVISRLYMCSPRNKERFYLRILLSQIKGVVSYEDVRTIDGNLYNTFEETVRQLGLLDEEDNEFDRCLKESATYQMPSQLRQPFASILLFCDPREFNAYKLLYDHWENLDEDYYHQQKRLRQDQQLSDNDWDIIVAKTLIAIEKYLLPYEKSLSDYSIPSPDYSLVENAKKNDLITQESNYDSDELEELLAKESLLNIDQKNI